MEDPIDPHTTNVLEFDTICTLLSQFAVSATGKSFCRKMTPLSIPSLIRQRLEEVTEMQHAVRLHGLLPLHNVSDIRPLLKRAKPLGVYLNPVDLIRIKEVIEASRLTRTYFTDLDAPCLTLAPLVSRLKTITTLEAAIANAIDTDATIADSASAALKSIRSKIRTTRDRIRSRLEDILNRHLAGGGTTDAYVTIRNDRYVIPVRSDVKSKVPGVVHDQSRLQATFFIEPLSVVESNNALQLLKQDEHEEERAVLESLTDLVREETPHLLENQRCLSVLDSVQARARMSIAMKARAPEVVEDGDIILKRARHPLLLLDRPLTQPSDHLPTFDNPQVVPVELIFPATFSVSIITGANMGGKTAALKTLGLLTLMAQAGMHIPVAEGSRLSVWQRMFADIGDEQSLERSESTFSSHVGHLINITEHAKKGSLVLLDEVGSGTDPQQGAALALAVTDHLRQRNVKVMVTSHLNLLKSYAVTTPDVLTVSVAFDAQTLLPTYSLIYGVPGESKAFETAARLGMSPHILAQAARYLDDKDRQALKLIEHVQAQYEAIQKNRTDLVHVLRSATNYENILETLLDKLTQRRADISAAMEKKVRALFRDAELQLKRALKLAAHSPRENLAEIKQTVAGLKKDVADSIPLPKPAPAKNLGVLEPGDTIILGKRGQKGIVLNVDSATNIVEVQVGDMRVKAQLDELAKLEGAEKQIRDDTDPSQFRFTTPETTGHVPPLTLLGLTVDEALPLVEKALDNALLARQSSLKIIHGYGTGRLKQAVHDFLEQQITVRNYYLADRREGGGGTTVVEVDV